MCWLKRDIWKAGIALAGILLFLVLLVWVPVSAAGAHEEASGLATPVTGIEQVTPTVNLTVTALSEEKLYQEVKQLINQNEPDLLSLLRTNTAVLVVVIGGLIGFLQWSIRCASQRVEGSRRRASKRERDTGQRSEG
jgi:hypothetical protein